MSATTSTIAEQLMAAQDGATMLQPITAGAPEFTVEDGYHVLKEIERRRRVRGWQSVGRKIGFTNRTIWPRYGVYQPNWAHIWEHTVTFTPSGETSLALNRFVQPRIEPEVVFKLKMRLPLPDDPLAVLTAVQWIAPGFEIVQSHFPDWKFAAPDCTAACALHAALIVGPPVAVTEANRAALATVLPTFALTLTRGETVVDHGVGANVLGSPALALAHFARLIANQPQFPPPAAGEIITTGTITDAWPVAAGETWSSDYGALGLKGLTVSFVEAPR
jgi:2-oxo-3-hexenedioate decarboxylase